MNKRTYLYIPSEEWEEHRLTHVEHADQRCYIAVMSGYVKGTNTYPYYSPDIKSYTIEDLAQRLANYLVLR